MIRYTLMPNPSIEALVNRETIARNEPLIRPYVRRTPVFSIDAADFGLPPAGVRDLKVRLSRLAVLPVVLKAIVEMAAA